MTSLNVQPYYIGLLSGTSMDGIDAVLVDFTASMPQLISTHSSSLPPSLQPIYQQILANKPMDLLSLGKLDHELGLSFAKAANNLLAQANIGKNQVAAIGSHGQTIFHHPQGDLPFSWQMGDPNVIAARTGITTVADFRRKDIAYGGQGAPLTPAFNQAFFANKTIPRIILNIGGIANITYLPTKGNIIGFDTGPGNTLLDQWAQSHLQQPFDKAGQWAASSTLHQPLFKLLTQDPYFQQLPPKSTGSEYFNLQWLKQYLDHLKIEPPSAAQVQATLVEITVHTIAESIQGICPPEGEIYVCGGGFYNTYLMDRLKHHCPNYPMASTGDLGIPPTWMEATAFAWFAKNTLAKQTSSSPTITGAHCSTILGGIYYP